MKSGFSRKLAIAVLCTLGIAGCGGSSGGGSSTGTVTFSLMDRPVDDVTALVVTITGARMKPQGDGPAIELPLTMNPMTVDLLSLTADNAAILVDGAVVPADDYNWIEFDIDDSDISKAHAMTVSGGMVQVDVDVPSDKLRLVNRFTVGDNEAVRFLFDWEVGGGLIDAVGRNLYILRPAFRILRVELLEIVSGRVTGNTSANDPVCNMAADPMIGKVVYFFAGTVTPDDTDGMDPDAVTRVDAEFDSDSGDYLFSTILDEGKHTVALTCFGNLETDMGNEDLMFLAPLGDSVIDVVPGMPITDIDF